MPVRPLLVTPIFPPLSGGASTYFATLVDGLRASVEVASPVVLTRGGPGLPRRERRDGVLVLRLLPAVEAGGRQDPLRRRAVSIATTAVVLAARRAARADLIHYHTMTSLRGMYHLARLVAIPAIADMRDLAARDEGVPLRYYTRCRAVICAAENIAAFLAARGFPPEKIRHIPLPFAPPRRIDAVALARTRKDFGLPTDAPYVCFVGSLMAGKGVARLLEAFRRLAANHPEFLLVLAGPHRRSEGATTDVQARLEHERRVRYVGAVTHAEALALMQGAALVVLPSRSEGLPRVCLEAIALGRKVLCPPGVPELERQCPGFVLPDLEPATIATRIAAAIAESAVPRYDFTAHEPGRIVAEVVRLYREVTAPRSAR